MHVIEENTKFSIQLNKEKITNYIEFQHYFCIENVVNVNSFHKLTVI
jgi:hypothetical protein